MQNSNMNGARPFHSSAERKQMQNSNMNGILKLCFLSLLSIVSTIATEPPEIEVSKANRAFTTTFYQALSKKGSDNIFFSPLGIHTVLSMIYQGADGSTKTALSEALQISEPKQAAEGYYLIINDINNVENITLYSVNKGYIDEGYKLIPDFENIIKEKFHSEVDSIEFDQAEAAASTINSWVNEKTKGKIPTLFKSEDFDPLTRLVLVNAIYFKGAWTYQFDKENTTTDTFYVNEDEEMNVQMMHKAGAFQFKLDNELGAKVLELPFNSRGVSMYFVLPEEKNGIADLEKTVQERGVDQIFKDIFWNIHVVVAVPKFKIETEIDLEKPLKDVGLGIIFDRDANLSKMIINAPELYVSKAIQKAYIDINEEGAEASASTGFVIEERIGKLHPPKTEYFHADHPFLVVLKKDENILFYGKIMRPV